ncbi:MULTISPECIES: 14-3-3 family protein [unclassified Pseudomonas]|uniref:14-3-3 family protein n=1 Tax=unclassified Pseudomonas TaxID=196821 RepID=UPI0025DB28CC|nr:MULTISPECIES: 14-3-3 family protein [unclassified Pseudomonas]
MSERERKAEGNENVREEAIKEKQEIEKVLRAFCNKLIKIVRQQLDLGGETVHKVLFGTLLGDIYTCLARILLTEERNSVIDQAQRSYNKAFDEAEKKLSTFDPYRLSSALSSSIFDFEILNQLHKACDFAKQTYDKAIVEIPSLNEAPETQEAWALMQQLRDKVLLWASYIDEE